jgi:hypothetical protein
MDDVQLAQAASDARTQSRTRNMLDRVLAEMNFFLIVS